MNVASKRHYVRQMAHFYGASLIIIAKSAKSTRLIVWQENGPAIDTPQGTPCHLLHATSVIKRLARPLMGYQRFGSMVLQNPRGITACRGLPQGIRAGPILLLARFALRSPTGPIDLCCSGNRGVAQVWMG
ncbi:hypothetical protein CDAR_27671 [Caerostris darwini]|uniref:Uncharacterized protein n=1 Tax=Caerostris darwini TaxID=1538125 RepID=A0AAV4STI8_9ARAC|nr:hypothetical protein CDAR_27671 [Caerostris darwini]